MNQLILALIALVLGVAHAQSYTLTEFDFPGAARTGALGINNAGQVIGAYSEQNGSRCFLRNVDGSFTKIELSSVGASCIAINNRGEIVGNLDSAHGYIRSASGEVKIFDLPSSGGSSGFPGVKAINDLGEIIGSLQIPVYGGTGFLRSPDGLYTTLTASIGGISPDTINNRGEIAGWVLQGSSQGTQHGFIRSSDGIYRTFDLPGTTSYTRITAMNNIGQIAGEQISYNQIFVSQLDGSFTVLGGEYTLTGLNDSGQIVGFRWDGDRTHAFVGTPARGSGEPTVRNVLTAAAFGGSPSIARGAWIEIYGQNLAPHAREWRSSDIEDGFAPTSLDGVRVSIGGVPAFVSYISPGQVNALVPSNVPAGTAVVTVTNQNLTSAPRTITVKDFQPALLSLPPDRDPRASPVAALFPDFMTYAMLPRSYSFLPTRLPKAGDTVILFGTGFGPVTPEISLGKIAIQPAALMASVEIEFLGATERVPGKITYAGLVPGTIGLYQFNVVVPKILFSNDETYAGFYVLFTVNGVSALGRDRLYFAIGK